MLPPYFQILIPYDGSDERRHGFDLVRGQWGEDSDFVRVLDGRIPKPRLLNDAIAALDGVEVIVLNDCDSLVPAHQFYEMLNMAIDEPGIVFGYTRYRRLSKEASGRMKFPVEVFLARDDDVEWEMALSGSHGCIAIRRECFLEAGGLDERFGACGYEDLAFNVVCESLWPSRRVAGDLFHIWHPRGWDADPANERRNRELYEREYLSRFGDRDALLGLVAAR